MKAKSRYKRPRKDVPGRLRQERDSARGEAQAPVTRLLFRPRRCAASSTAYAASSTAPCASGPRTLPPLHPARGRELSPGRGHRPRPPPCRAEERRLSGRPPWGPSGIFASALCAFLSNTILILIIGQVDVHGDGICKTYPFRFLGPSLERGAQGTPRGGRSGGMLPPHQATMAVTLARGDEAPAASLRPPPPLRKRGPEGNARSAGATWRPSFSPSAAKLSRPPQRQV